MNLLVLLLIALPACLAQFSIQGPSDGNRVAQGLRIEEGKGIEYTDQNAGHEGGFTIQGASDGHSQVQSGTDGHSNFNIQGATSGGADRYTLRGPVTGSYTIQGATADHQSGVIQSTYDGDPASAKNLQYNDPSGLRVNWRSFDRQPRPGPPQQHLQYSEDPIQSAPRAPPRQRAHPRPQPAPQPQPIAIQQSKTLDSAPGHIKQLLQFQQQIPYVNIIPEPFRFDALSSLSNANQQQSHYQPEPQQEIAQEQRPVYRGKPRGPPRHRRQAPQHRPEAQQQQQQQQQQPYRRVSRPPPEPQINYNPNLPPQLQQLLKYQAQTPYINIIPEQFRFNPDTVAQAQLEEFRNHYQELIRQQPSSPTVHAAPPPQRPGPVPRPSHPRERRQAPYRGQPQRPQPQQLPVEPQPHYSTNLPGHLQSLLKYQSQIPYSIIANQINYRPEKPYIPQPAQPTSASPIVQYQGEQDSYQGQPSGNSQVYSSQLQYPQYSQYSQPQPGYQHPGDSVRPVKENQY